MPLPASPLPARTHSGNPPRSVALRHPPRSVIHPSTDLCQSTHCPSNHDELAGVRGNITRYVTTIPSASSTYHFFELDVSGLDADWLESKERRREWVDFAEAVKRVSWKQELAQGLMLSTLAPHR